MSSSGLPDASNTGVPLGVTLTPAAGMTISAAGAVVSGLNITGMVTISASNVTLENCKISADAYASIVVEAGATGVNIENCEIYGGGINGTNNAGSLGIYIQGGGVNVENCNIYGSANGISINSMQYGPVLIKNNYIHDIIASGGANHYNGIQYNGNTGGIGGLLDIEHNTIINNNTQTDAIMIDNYFGPVNGVTVNNNLLIGGGYTVYSYGGFNSSPVTNVSITNNHLGGGYYGDYYPGLVASVNTGNVDDGDALLQTLVQNPTITKINASPATGDFNVGQTVTLTLDLNETVTVAGGTPTLTLNDGGVATYTGGSGTGALTFRTTVAAGQNTASLAATAINLNGATIQDRAGNAARLSLTGLTQSGPQIDTTAPTVSSIEVARISAQRRSITVTFSEPVLNFGPNDVFLSSGTLRSVTGSGSTWTVKVGQVTSKGMGFLIKSSGTGSAYWIDAAGNGGIGTPETTVSPAGAAGAPINLALTDQAAGHVGAIKATISGVPIGWSLSEGNNQGNGVWTIRTNNISALSVASPLASIGALSINVAENWTNADGSVGKAIIADNVETYSQGEPIFAWSGDDHLSGSNGNDVFVFSQPIGNDTINAFDTEHDKIDLIGNARLKNFADVRAHLADDAAGNAVITLGAGETISLIGVSAKSLTASNFLFNQTPTTTNTGDIVVADSAMLALGGTVHNTGTIALNSTGDNTDLEIAGQRDVFSGGGQITLSGTGQNVIYGATASTTLRNVDNTISGAGMIGNGAMTLVNGGTIDGNQPSGLVIDTGSGIIVNSGIIETTAGGSLTVDSAVANFGSLLADGGKLTLNGDVSGSGSATISKSSTLDYGSASSENTSFARGASGTLALAQSTTFTGSISGFGRRDNLDLMDISEGSATLDYAENRGGIGGRLTVSDGTHTAILTLFGQYSAAGFHSESDPSGGAIITYTEPSTNSTRPMFLAKSAA